MRSPSLLVSAPFRLDLRDERLWRNDRPIRLSHKGFTVLRCLMSHPGQLVTKDDLFAAAWRETLVTEASLTTTVREVRRALDDQARSPSYIETVHGRGYRFLAPVEFKNRIPLPPAAGPAAESASDRLAVDQKTEIDVLLSALERALKDRGGIVVVVGNPEGGQTRKVQELARLAEQHSAVIDIVSVIDRQNQSGT